MVEVVVMLMIITAVSATVLVGFGSTREGAALNRSARELALAIRRAQNMSLAVTQVDTLAGPKVPPAVGVRLAQGGETYFLFADLADNKKYDADDVKIAGADNLAFERGVKIKSLTYLEVSSRRTAAAAQVVFAAPEAAMYIADANGDTLGEVIEIELAGPSGRLIKTVTVRTSGQVSIK